MSVVRAFFLTSPRVRGEVALRSKAGEGQFANQPLTRLAASLLTTLSPQAGRGKEKGN